MCAAMNETAAAEHNATAELVQCKVVPVFVYVLTRLAPTLLSRSSPSSMMSRMRSLKTAGRRGRQREGGRQETRAEGTRFGRQYP